MFSISLLLIILLSLTVLALWRFQYGLISLAISLPLEHYGTIHLGATTVRLSQLAVAAIIIAGSVHLIRSRRLPNVKVFLPLGLLLTSLTLTAFHYNYSPIWLGTIITAALCMFTYILAVNLKMRHLDLIYKSLLFTGVATSLFGLYQYIGDTLGLPQTLTGLRDQYTKDILGYPRIHSLAFEPMYYANFLLIPLFLIFGRWLTKIQLKLWEFGAGSIITLTFFLTMSRGAILAAAITAVIAISLCKFKVYIRPRVIISIGSIVLVAAALIMAASLTTGQNGLERYGRLLSVDLVKTGSFTERSVLREKAISIWQSSPIMGVGIEGVGPYVNNYPQPYSDYYFMALHSHFLELLAQAGIIGVGGYYIFLALVLLSAYRLIKSNLINDSHKAWLIGLSAAVIAIHIQAQSFSGFFLTHIWFSLALLTGVILLSWSKSDTIEE